MRGPKQEVGQCFLSHWIGTDRLAATSDFVENCRNRFDTCRGW